MKKALHLAPNDDVAIAVEPLAVGDTIAWDSHGIQVQEPIGRGHKIAVRAIAQGERVYKYGFPIGVATADIPQGAWVHVHNVRTALAGKLEYVYQPEFGTRNQHEMPEMPTSFRGYMRDDGQVGTRNEIWIINTVGCVNKVAERLAAMADARWRGQGIDGVHHFPHPYGCSQLGDDLAYTQSLLAGLARHPNAAGVLIVGLGCENNRIASFRSALSDIPQEKLRFLELQSTTDEFASGMSLLAELVQYASRYKREETPVAKLKIGLKCGGSDGFSGMTANPLVGRVADWITAHAGTALLTEVPEMFGAETIFMQRAESQMVFERIVDLINRWKDYYQRHGQPIYENPSPGNRDGGITTLEEKSLGCVQKGGRSASVVDVIAYGQSAQKPGLNLVEAPGNDMVSVSALAAAGAQLVLFTTGRGTPLGGPVPTLKIATNSDLARQKPGWIDFDAGLLMDGVPFDELALQLYEQVIRVASGDDLARNEQNGYREIAIFKDGVTL
ncbi:UxaA family hydrolase [Alicyclobacillus sacchari]|nr:altronate dehydratase family protein [Alicyclobacillus sacchari]